MSKDKKQVPVSQQDSIDVDMIEWGHARRGQEVHDDDRFVRQIIEQSQTLSNYGGAVKSPFAGSAIKEKITALLTPTMIGYGVACTAMVTALWLGGEMAIGPVPDGRFIETAFYEAEISEELGYFEQEIESWEAEDSVQFEEYLELEDGDFLTLSAS